MITVLVSGVTKEKQRLPRYRERIKSELAADVCPEEHVAVLFLDTILGDGVLYAEIKANIHKRTSAEKAVRIVGKALRDFVDQGARPSKRVLVECVQRDPQALATFSS